MTTTEAVKVAREVDALIENIGTNGLFEGQVTDTEQYNIDTATFKVTIAPKDGNHQEGKYVFKIEMEGISGPQIYCQTAIYHPNINIITGEVSGIDLKLDYSVQNVVKELLGLMRTPNFSKSLIEIDSTDPKDFYADTKTSIAGGRVGPYLFPMNEGYAKLHPDENAEGERIEEPVEGWELVDRNFGIKQYVESTPDDGDDDVDDGDDDVDDGDDDEGNGDDDDDDEE